MDIWFLIERGLLITALVGATAYVFMVTVIIWSDHDKKKHLKK